MSGTGFRTERSSRVVMLVTTPVDDGKLRLAVAAFLARYRGRTRKQHEAYLSWMQEVRNYSPATVSQWISAIAGFYRT